MALEPPLHEPENKDERKRDLGHTLVLVGYLLIVSDLILGCYLFIAMRGEGGKVMMVVLALDLVVAIGFIVVGGNMKKKASRLGS
ncbi:MAG TPA: hypothetical protein VL382_00440 [Terriglobales bacterium]|nr:hypothetical protein [Terriglobales bacterium]